MFWYGGSCEDGRTCKLLTLDIVKKHCFFGFVLISEKNKVIIAAWRKQLKPINSCDSTGYTGKGSDGRDGEWTIQFEKYGSMGQKWSGEIKENRSDNIVMRDINQYLGISRRQYPDIPSYFYKQEYHDQEFDEETYRIVRLKMDERIIAEPKGKKWICLNEGEIAEIRDGNGNTRIIDPWRIPDSE